jgi:hypothetical protein
MPPKYEKWLPRFTGSDGERADYHMVDFWSFFQLHPISDDAEDLVMKLFSATLHGNARKWYDNLPVASITSMDQLEVIFLRNWGMKLKDVQTLLKKLDCIRQTENETVRDFEGRFQRLLYQIPATYTPEEKYLVYLYTNALLVHLGFLLSKKRPKTLNEAYSMAIQIEANISLSKGKHIFSLGTKIDDPKDTSDTLSLEKSVSLGAFTVDFQEEGEQVFDQQDAKGKDLDEVFQEKRIVEETVEEPEPKQDDEISTCPPLSNEAIHEPFSPAQEETNTMSYPPLQNFDDSLIYDLGNEEEMDEPLNVLNPPCYDTDTDIVDIDEFIHVGGRKWDVVGYDMDPIYDIENHFQVLPSQLSQQVTLDFGQWQQGNDMITDAFQTPKVDLVPYFPDDFWSYLEDFDEYSSEHLDPFHEDDFQPPLCSGLDRSKNIVCLKKDSCDSFLQPPPITLPCCVIKGVVGKYVFFY